jgi:ferric-dicitrate binding protein FerR (iron transport regulator)
VRGTEFEIDAPLKGPAKVTVMDGKVEIIVAQKDRVVEVNTGERVVIHEDGGVENPVKVNPRSAECWWMEE